MKTAYLCTQASGFSLIEENRFGQKNLDHSKNEKKIKQKKVWSVILPGKGGFTQERITNKYIKNNNLDCSN